MTHSGDFKVSVGMVTILQSYAASRGIAFNDVAERHGFNIDILKNGEAKILARTFEALWLEIAMLSQDPFPGLNFGKQAADHYPTGGILFSMMLNCPTISKALDVFVRYHRIVAEQIQPLVEVDEAFTHLSWDLSMFHSPSQPYLSEALLCTYHSILAKLSKGRIRPVCVSFIHPKPNREEDVAEYETYFQAPVHFRSSGNELVIGNRDLDLEIELADASLLALLERHATRLMAAIPHENKWSGKVAQLVAKEIFSGSAPVIETIARNLAVSKRSLQDKLKNEGTCFRDLVQTIRKQIAVEQLSDPEVSLSEVAFMLGYSDQSAFNHAFKSWTGKSPKKYTSEPIVSH